MGTPGSELPVELFPKIEPTDSGLRQSTDSLDIGAAPLNEVPNVPQSPFEKPATENQRSSADFSAPTSDAGSLNTDAGIQQIFQEYQNRQKKSHSDDSKEGNSEAQPPSSELPSPNQKSRKDGHDSSKTGSSLPNNGRFFPKIKPFLGSKNSSNSTFSSSLHTGTDLGVSKDWDQTSVSLDSQIMQALARRSDLSEIQGNSANKFPYVAWYEAAARDRGETGSTFGLSSLDEFSQFVELTKLNQRIADKVSGWQGSGPKPLQVLDAQEFQRYHQENLESKSSETGKSKRRPSSARPPSRWPFCNFSFGKQEKKSHYLHRSLKVRHLQMISLGGTLGVGLYLNSGKAFTMAGGFGTLLAFLLVGLLVLATVNSFCEMVTFVSVVDGVSGLSSRFVDESFGFATGWLYFFSFSLGLAGEVVASIIILSSFPSTEIGLNAGATAGFTSLFLGVCFVSNMIPVSIFGEIEYLCSLFKVVATLGGIIVMIVINRGAMGDQGVTGFKYWQYEKSDFEQKIIFGLFRPTFDLSSTGLGDSDRAINGNLGRFLSLLTAINIASYAYSGTEIVCIAACEAKDPRKALPSATKRVFWRILIFYCLASFMVSLNLYAGDPRLLRYYQGTSAVSAYDLSSNQVVQYLGGSKCKNRVSSYGSLGSGFQSPWVVAFQSAGLCSWSVVGNVCLFVFALSCGNSHLYVSSRTAFSLALQDMAPSFLKRCNRFGTPYYAVMVAILPAFLSYTCVTRQSTIVFQNLTSVISATGVFVWFAMCISYVRFYYGLQKRPDTVPRDHKAYPYKSPLQPYSAIFGVIGSGIVLLSMGFVVFLDGYWNTMFFFSSYGALIVFALLYLGHRVIKGSSFSHLETLDFDSGRRENDIYVWDGGREYNMRSFRDVFHKLAHMIA